MAEEIDRPYSFMRLKDLVKESYDADERTFREMRSAIRMFAGDHFSKTANTSSSDSGREFARLSKTSGVNRIRIVKNHFPRIADVYVNQIMESVPDVEVTGINGADIKASRLARLNNQVLSADKRKSKKYKQKLREKALNFVVTGEIALKHYWDENTEWVKEEEILPFDLLRAPGTTKVEDSPWLIHRNIYSVEDLKRMFGADWVKRNAMMEGDGITFSGETPEPAHTVFDVQQREFQKMRGLEIREFYLRPNAKYPNGYYIFFSDTGIIQEGELPGGIFPITAARCLITPSVSRGHTPFKTVYQMQQEINRAAGQDASNNIHFGDDKLFSGAHANIQVGRSLQGMSHIKVGQYGAKIADAFQVVPGTGIPKNLDYISQQIREMDYQLNIESMMESKQVQGSGDISFVLYSSIKDKNRFSFVAQSFEEFLKEAAETKLRLFRHYLLEDDLIHEGNREDSIIIEDFKQTDESDYSIEVKARNNTPDELLGRHIQVNNVLQYAGNALKPEDLGPLLKESLLGNSKALISHFSAGQDAVEQNIILLEKGVLPKFSKTEDFTYKAKQITQRMNRPDYLELHPDVQKVFEDFLEICHQMIAKQNQERMKMEKGMIPTTGGLVNTDIFRMVPGAKGRPVERRIKLPSHALEWLIEALQSQGTFAASMEGMSPMSQGRVGDLMGGNQPGPGMEG